jgi:hypothetical protein
MQDKSQTETDKKEIAAAYLSDVKNDLTSGMEIIPVTDAIKEAKEKYLDTALNFCHILMTVNWNTKYGKLEV